MATAVAQETLNCPEGRVDVGGGCCFPEQVWADTMKACKGIPRCDAGWHVEGEICARDLTCGGATPVADQGHCCAEGQRYSHGSQRCLGIPTRCPDPFGVPGVGNPGPEQLQSCNVCGPGTGKSGLTEPFCCWPGQALRGSRCVGTPTSCPAGFEASVDGCDVPACEFPRERTDDGVGCCWPDQVWVGSCKGKPSCPRGWSRDGESCRFSGASQTDSATRLALKLIAEGSYRGMSLDPDAWQSQPSLTFSSVMGLLLQGLKPTSSSAWMESLHANWPQLPRVEVKVSRPFWLMSGELTQGEWKRYSTERPWEDCPEKRYLERMVRDDLPVFCLSWRQAVEFANAVSRSSGLEPAYRLDGQDVYFEVEAMGYRLPTSAEWELAARAGLDGPFVGTGDPALVCSYDNVADRGNPFIKEEGGPEGAFTCSDGSPLLAGQGLSFKANPWGLRHMGGNVAEWVFDAQSPDPGAGAEGAKGPRRLLRGGSLSSAPDYSVLVPIRWVDADTREFDAGLRLARNHEGR